MQGLRPLRPKLSDVLGTPRVPDSSTSKPNDGIFNTMTRQSPDAMSGTFGRVADATGNWVDGLAPAWTRPLSATRPRSTGPIGSWLLLLPCWWSVALAAIPMPRLGIRILGTCCCCWSVPSPCAARVAPGTISLIAKSTRVSSARARARFRPAR